MKLKHFVIIETDEENDAYITHVDAKDASEALCGQKGVIYTILSIASETCNILKQIDKGESNFKIIKREMKSLRILGG